MSLKLKRIARCARIHSYRACPVKNPASEIEGSQISYFLNFPGARIETLISYLGISYMGGGGTSTFC